MAAITAFELTTSLGSGLLEKRNDPLMTTTMTTSIPAIDQLINLATRVAQASLNGLRHAESAATQRAIQAVCHHLRREGGYRSDVVALVEMCEAATSQHSGEGQERKSNDLQDTDTPVLLTTRQKEILELLERGLSYKEIATQLNLSALTIKNHARAIYERLQVQNKTEAIFEARQMGIIRK